jgi:6-phosphogluconolactonase
MRFGFLFILIFLAFNSFAQKYFLFIGTFTDKGSKGIYVYRFNATTGEAGWVSNTDSVVNPAFLAVASDGKHLYAVNETNGANPGHVSSFSFDKTTGRLTFINQQLSGGDNPCYVSLNKENTWLVAGNYGGGNLSAFPVNKDGSLQPYAQLIQHEGSGPDKQRQEKPHVHCTIFSPDQHYLFVPDLGIDKVMIYRFNPGAALPLSQADTPFMAASEPGSGPRHFTFHPNGKYAYLIEELSGTIEAFQYNNGKLTFLQKVATHPDDYKGAIGSADIHVSPDGRFLYASNRGGENTITIFSVNTATGKLMRKDFQPTLGVMPRNFMIDPSGNYLLVANQSTNNIVIFKRNRQTGMLQPTGKQIEVPTPVCLKMIPVE